MSTPTLLGKSNAASASFFPGPAAGSAHHPGYKVCYVTTSWNQKMSWILQRSALHCALQDDQQPSEEIFSK